MDDLPSPALQEVNGILLQGRALVDVAFLVAAGLRAAYRDDGIAPSPRLRHLAERLAAAATSVSGHADVRELLDSSSLLTDEITVTEAAEMLGLTVRQARRVVPALGARKTSAGWLVLRGAVSGHVQERSIAS